MFHAAVSAGFRLAGRPAFRIHGRGRREKAWRVIDVYATHRRDLDSRWPGFLFRGTCITWTSAVIAVGWDFAETLLLEQGLAPASRDHPVEVAGGRLHSAERRKQSGGLSWATASEIVAHEVGHTWQATRMSALYWPVGAAFTLWREGPRWYNHFENQASEEGLFGGLVNGSVCPQLMSALSRGLSPNSTRPGTSSA